MKPAWDVQGKVPGLKKEASIVCVRETPAIKMKPAWDV